MTKETGNTGKPDDRTREIQDILLQAGSQIDNADSYDTDPISLMREEWTERTYPLTSQELGELLLSQEFGEHVTTAIAQTDNIIPEEDKVMVGQEFGFVVFSHPGSIEPIRISPVFAGTETSIDLYEQSYAYAQQEGLFGSRAFIFHTHMNESLVELYRVIDPSLPDSDCFSRNDLVNFKKIARMEDSSLIYALGKSSPDRDSGSVLLISFNNLDQFIDFDPDAVYEQSMQYKENISGIPIDVYQKAGLNVAVLQVDFDSEIPFNPEEVQNASEILTRRSP